MNAHSKIIFFPIQLKQWETKYLVLRKGKKPRVFVGYFLVVNEIKIVVKIFFELPVSKYFQYN